MIFFLAFVVYLFLGFIPSVVLFVKSRRLARTLPDAASQVSRGRRAAMASFALAFAVHFGLYVGIPLVNGTYLFVGWLVNSWASFQSWVFIALAIALFVYGKRKQDARALGAVRGLAGFVMVELVLAYPYAALLAALGVRGTYG